MATPAQLIKVDGPTKDRVRYLAAVQDTTQSAIVELAVVEYTSRHAKEIEKGIARAREVLAGGDESIAAYLLDVPLAQVKRVAGRRTSGSRNAQLLTS